jgi:hypothetical protein
VPTVRSAPGASICSRSLAWCTCDALNGVQWKAQTMACYSLLIQLDFPALYRCSAADRLWS